MEDNKYFSGKYVDLFADESTKQTDAWAIQAFSYFSKLAKPVFDDSSSEIEKSIYGVLDKDTYDKYINPYHIKNDEGKDYRYPGTLRNIDIIMPVVRRYVGEYVTASNVFHIVSKIPNEENAYLKDMGEYLNKLIDKKVNYKLKEAGLPADENGENVDIAVAAASYQKKYKDSKAARDATLLDYVRASTNDEILYGLCYFDWITYGGYFIDRYVDHNDIVKQRIDLKNVKVVTGGSEYADDYEAFIYTNRVAFTSAYRMFEKILTPTQLNTLKEYVVNNKGEANGSSFMRSIYDDLIYNAYQSQTWEHQFLSSTGEVSYSKMYFKAFKAVNILKYIGVDGKETEMPVELDYELNTDAGDISLTREYIPTIYMMYFIGTYPTGIYTKPIELDIQRNKLDDVGKCKLPVTGKWGIGNGMPNHSIVKTLIPYQVFHNTIYLARERAIHKNIGKVAVLPYALLSNSDMNADETLYRMYADGKLFIGMDSAGLLLQAIKELNLSDSEYITSLGNLINENKQAAMDAVDMNRQRYGDTYSSDGKSVTEQALIRSSMGTAFVNAAFNVSRSNDYNADIDYTKFAFIDGKKAKFVNPDGNDAFLEIEGVGHANTEYNTYCMNSAKYNRQLQRLQDFAFAAGQNGDANLAVSAIVTDDINKVKTMVEEYTVRAQERMQKMEDAKNAALKYKADMEADTKAKEMALKDGMNQRDNEYSLIIAELNATVSRLETEIGAERERLNNTIQQLGSVSK